MIEIDVKGFVDWINRIGVVGLLALFVVGFQQGWWFFGRERDALEGSLEAMRKDRDEWKLLALSSMGAAERTVRAASAALPAPEGVS